MTSSDLIRHPTKDKRRANKPLLERKRRAKINTSLATMKNLVLTFLNKDASKYTKMEKVDILEMTVQYLKKQYDSRGGDYNSVYRTAIDDCKRSMYKQVMSLDGLDTATKYKILSQITPDPLSTPPPSPVLSDRSLSPTTVSPLLRHDHVQLRHDHAALRNDHAQLRNDHATLHHEHMRPAAYTAFHGPPHHAPTVANFAERFQQFHPTTPLIAPAVEHHHSSITLDKISSKKVWRPFEL